MPENLWINSTSCVNCSGDTFRSISTVTALGYLPLPAILDISLSNSVLSFRNVVSSRANRSARLRTYRASSLFESTTLAVNGDRTNFLSLPLNPTTFMTRARTAKLPSSSSMLRMYASERPFASSTPRDFSVAAATLTSRMSARNAFSRYVYSGPVSGLLMYSRYASGDSRCLRSLSPASPCVIRQIESYPVPLVPPSSASNCRIRGPYLFSVRSDFSDRLPMPRVSAVLLSSPVSCGSASSCQAVSAASTGACTNAARSCTLVSLVKSKAMRPPSSRPCSCSSTNASSSAGNPLRSGGASASASV